MKTIADGLGSCLIKTDLGHDISDRYTDFKKCPEWIRKLIKQLCILYYTSGIFDPDNDNLVVYIKYKWRFSKFCYISIEDTNDIWCYEKGNSGNSTRLFKQLENYIKEDYYE